MKSWLWGRRCVPVVALVWMLCSPAARAAEPVRVGSNVFTESVILGELATRVGRAAGVGTVHRSQLGGMRVLWESLRAGQIDVYPEYTGIIAQELIPGTPLQEDALRKALAARGVGMTRPLGFNDTYALAMPETLATRLNVKTIGDLRRCPALRMGFSNEFIERKDGWSAARLAYDLPQANVTSLDHDLAYRSIADGRSDVTDVYATEAEIAFYHLRVLEDDQKHLFPEYKAVYLYRSDLNERAPAFLQSLGRLEGAIDAATMIRLNGAVTLQKRSEAQVAAEFLKTQLRLGADVNQRSAFDGFLARTGEHVFLVGLSLLASAVVGVPLGVLAFARPKAGHAVVAVTSLVFTVPALALFVFMIQLFGIGKWPALVALFLYGLLPIVRNTQAGLAGIPQGLRDSAVVLGLSPLARLMEIELPLAAPLILAGVKTAAVIDVGAATIAALIGAGGYGQPILTGIRLADNRLILAGAIPAALLALLLQWGFGLLGRYLVPHGLRSGTTGD